MVLRAMAQMKPSYGGEGEIVLFKDTGSNVTDDRNRNCYSSEACHLLVITTGSVSLPDES